MYSRAIIKMIVIAVFPDSLQLVKLELPIGDLSVLVEAGSCGLASTLLTLLYALTKKLPSGHPNP